MKNIENMSLEEIKDHIVDEYITLIEVRNDIGDEGFDFNYSMFWGIVRLLLKKCPESLLRSFYVRAIGRKVIYEKAVAKYKEIYDWYDGYLPCDEILGQDIIMLFNDFDYEEK